jgi:hypothetical protein
LERLLALANATGNDSNINSEKVKREKADLETQFKKFEEDKKQEF